MIRSDRRLRQCRTLLVCVLVFIWGNSLLPGEVSEAFSNWVKGILEVLFAREASRPSSGGLLRKIAHFTEFAALGALLCWRAGMLKKSKAAAFGCGVLAACIDETIQCFVPGRGPGLRDVCIDSAGVLTGIVLTLLGHTYFKKRTVN